MSTTIDSKVVEMRFDNRQFESGVSTTMSTLENLKQKLRLDGATKGMEEVNAAANKVNLAGIGNAVETVGLKFNAMYTIADQALRNITNAAMNCGRNVLNELAIKPITTGLKEYETQINAVQTILANTESKGSTLKDVNGALDELNAYADKTIYNFTEMTRNIGTFTAAGVDLDTSVNAIQGIANLAAVSGSNSQQASTAMYQLSQALSSGTVKLMDWNSVVNAGMGGQVFQDALKETSRAMADRAKELGKMSKAERAAYQEAHGYTDAQMESMMKYDFKVDKLIEKNGSFRESLTAGWITADVLTETLSHFTMAAEEGSKEWNDFKKTLMDQGYSEEQANAILKMSNTATDAATKVKTAAQLFDTLKETAQSGWTQTWEIIMGDFEEAKNLFSMLYETISPVIEASSKARNDILEGWAKAGGRDDLIKSLQNIFEAVGSIVKPIKEAFSEIFPADLDDKVKMLSNFTKGIKDFTAKLTLSDDASKNLKRTFKGLFAIFDIVGKVIGSVFKAISPLFGTVDDLGGGILGVTAKIGDWLVSLNESIEASGFFTKAVEKIHGAFEKVKNFLQPVIDSIKNFASEFGTNMTAVADNAQERLGPLAKLGNFIKGIFTGLGNIFKTIFPYITSAASAIGNVLGDLMNRISDSIQNANYDSFFDLTSGGIIAAIGVFIAKFIKSGDDLLKNAGGFMEAIKSIPENLGNILGGASEALGAFTESIKADTLKKIATAIGILAVSLLVLSLIPSEKLTEALVSITTLFGELMVSMNIMSKMGDMKGVTKTAGAIVMLAGAMLTLSIALKIMSTMSWAEMGVGLISMVVGLGALVGAVWALSMMPEKELKNSAKAIKTLAPSLLVLSVALKIMSTMSWEGMGIALISMTVGLAALVGAIYLLPKDTALRAAGLIGLATAMVILGGALKIMATMSWAELAVSLVALAGSLAIIAIAMNLMVSAIPGALAMLIVAPALIVLAGAMKILGSMSWDEVGRGLVALGGSLAILAIGLTLMMAALPGAAALLVAAAALAVLTPVLMALGSMSLAEIGKGLLAIAGVFTVLGLAALILQPLVPTILGLAGAIALLGIGCVAAGAGVLMIGAGITALAAALAASGGAITVFVASIISLIPFLAEQIGLGIIKLCEAIAGGSEAICEAVAVIIVAVIDALVAAVPPLVEGLLVLIESLLTSLIDHLPTIVTQLAAIIVNVLNLLSEHTPAIVEALFVFLGTVIQAIADNINRLVEPLVSIVVAIVQGIVDIIGPIIQNVIAPLVQLITDILSGIAIVINSVAAAVASALNGLANVFSSIFNGIATVITSVGDAIKTAMEGIATVIESIGTAIEDSLNGLSGVFDSVFNGIATVVESVGDSIKTVLDGIAGVIDSIGEAALNAGTGFENLANGVKTITNLKLGDMVASLGAVAGGIGDIAAHSKGIGSVADGMSGIYGSASGAASGFKVMSTSVSTASDKLNALPAVITSVVQKCTTAAGNMKNVGTAFMDNLIKSIKSKESSAKGTCITIVTVCATAIRSKVSAFKSAGNDLGSGLVQGINAKQTAAYNAGYALGQAAVQGEKDGQKSKSPSKLTIQAGKWIGEGLVIGMNKMSDEVYDTGHALGETSVDALSEVISGASKSFDDELVVRPTFADGGYIDGARTALPSAYRAGHDLGEGYVKGAESMLTFVRMIGYALGAAGIKGIQEGQDSHSPSVKAQQEGIYLGAGYVGGVSSMLSLARNAGYALGAAGIKGIQEGQDSHSPSVKAQQEGEYLGTGYIGGVSSMLSLARNAGYALGAAGVKGIQEGQNSHSPSVEGEEQGAYLVEGYANGIENNLDEAKHTAETLATTVIRWLSTNCKSLTAKVPWLSQLLFYEEVDTKETAKKVSATIKRLYQEAEESPGTFISKGAFWNGVLNRMAMVKTGLSETLGNAMTDAVDSVDWSNALGNTTTEFSDSMLSGLNSVTPEISAGVSDVVSEAMTVDTTEVVGNMTEIMTQVTEAIESGINAEPTIRPVLDLTKLKEDIATMNGLFTSGSNPTLTVTAIISGQMQENQYGDIINAINDVKKSLGGKIDNISKPSYYIGNITYDDGSTVSNAIQTITRAARIERRT